MLVKGVVYWSSGNALYVVLSGGALRKSSNSTLMTGAVIVLLSYTFMVYKTFGKIHLSFLVPEELGAWAWEWEEPKGSTTRSLPRSTVLGTQYKTSQMNSLAEAGLCLGQGARSDAEERVHLWGSPRGSQ